MGDLAVSPQGPLSGWEWMAKKLGLRAGILGSFRPKAGRDWEQGCGGKSKWGEEEEALQERVKTHELFSVARLGK